MKAAAHMSLSELAAEVQESLDADFGGRRMRVLAETCDVKVYWNRTYAFLDLIEKREGQLVAKMGAVVWSRDFGIIQKFKKLTGQNFEENLELLLEVELQFNPRYGLRLSIVSIDENYTLGKLQAEKDQTLEKLLAAASKFVWRDGEEIRSANQELRPGQVMQRIVLLAAAGSDGRRDFLHELEQNPYDLDFSVLDLPVQVQGEQAARQIGAAFASRARGAGSALAARLRALVLDGATSRGLLLASRYLPQRRSLVFLVSDFHWPLADLRAVLHSLAPHALVPVVLGDAQEAGPATPRGLLTLIDAETGRRQRLWWRPALRERLADAQQQRRAALLHCFAAHRLRPLFIDGAFDADAVTRHFLA